MYNLRLYFVRVHVAVLLLLRDFHCSALQRFGALSHRTGAYNTLDFTTIFTFFHLILSLTSSSLNPFPFPFRPYPLSGCAASLNPFAIHNNHYRGRGGLVRKICHLPPPALNKAACIPKRRQKEAAMSNDDECTIIFRRRRAVSAAPWLLTTGQHHANGAGPCIHRFRRLAAGIQ